ncbi:MAG: recombinase family protein [Pseudonocardiaceae bacterium]
MTGLKIGYVRVSTDDQDLTAQRDALAALDVTPDRIYVDYADRRVMPTSVAKPLVGKVIEPCRSA